VRQGDSYRMRTRGSTRALVNTHTFMHTYACSHIHSCTHANIFHAASPDLRADSCQQAQQGKGAAKRPVNGQEERAKAVHASLSPLIHSDIHEHVRTYICAHTKKPPPPPLTYAQIPARQAQRGEGATEEQRGCRPARVER
jgi:hypothetical protein